MVYIYKTKRQPGGHALAPRVPLLDLATQNNVVLLWHGHYCFSAVQSSNTWWIPIFFGFHQSSSTAVGILYYPNQQACCTTMLYTFLFFSFCLILASHYLLYASIFTYYKMSCCKFNYPYINRLCIVFIIHRFDSNPILSCTVTYGFCSTVQKRIRNLEYICSSTHVLIHMWHGHEQLLLHGFQNRCFHKLF